MSTISAVNQDLIEHHTTTMNALTQQLVKLTLQEAQTDSSVYVEGRSKFATPIPGIRLISDWLRERDVTDIYFHDGFADWPQDALDCYDGLMFSFHGVSYSILFDSEFDVYLFTSADPSCLARLLIDQPRAEHPESVVINASHVGTQVELNIKVCELFFYITMYAALLYGNRRYQALPLRFRVEHKTFVPRNATAACERAAEMLGYSCIGMMERSEESMGEYQKRFLENLAVGLDDEFGAQYMVDVEYEKRNKD